MPLASVLRDLSVVGKVRWTLYAVGISGLMALAVSGGLFILVHQQSKLLDREQPAMLLMGDLDRHVGQSVAATKSYVLSKSEGAVARRQGASRDAKAALEALIALEGAHPDYVDPSELDLLAVNLNALSLAQEQIFAVAHLPESLPATQLFVSQAGPAVQQLGEAITAMIDLEKALPATSERKALLGVMADSRGSLGLGVASLRAFLLTADPMWKADFKEKWAVNQARFEALNSQAGLLTFEQMRWFQRYSEARASFDPLPSQMFEIRESRAWSRAIFLLDSSVDPAAEQVTKQVESLLERYRRASETQAARLRLLGGVLMALMAGMAVFACIAWFWLAKRGQAHIADRLGQLLEATQQIAEGDYEVDIPSHGGDELDLLGNSIVSMAKTLSIRRTELRRGENVISAFPTPMIVGNSSDRIESLNPAMVHVLGRLGTLAPCQAQGVIGEALSRFLPEGPWRPPGERSPQNTRGVGDLLALGGNLFRVESTPLYTAEGGYDGSVTTWEEVTESETLRARSAVLDLYGRSRSAVLQSISSAKEEGEVISIALKSLYETLSPLGAQYLRASDEGSLEPALNFGQANLPESATFLATLSLSSHEIGIVEDGPTPEEDALREGVVMSVVSPLVVKGDARGVLVLTRAGSWGEPEALKDMLRGLLLSMGAIIERTNRSRADRARSIFLSGRVESLLEQVSLVAKGDLTVSLSVVGEDPVGRVGNAVGSLVDDICFSIRGIEESAMAVAKASETLSATSLQMSAGATRTNTQAREATNAAGSLVLAMDSVSDVVEEVTREFESIGVEASGAAEVGYAAMDIVQSTNKTIEQLKESSSRIGEVNDVITSIAKQTNLLALNATIEAARAGEAGKGFAVVAKEVKGLALQTANATEDINARIRATQEDAQACVAAIAEVSAIISKINSAQGNICRAVGRHEALNLRLGTSIHEALGALGFIKSSVSETTRTAEDTQAGAGGTESAARQLAQTAAELLNNISRFQTH